MRDCGFDDELHEWITDQFTMMFKRVEREIHKKDLRLLANTVRVTQFTDAREESEESFFEALSNPAKLLVFIENTFGMRIFLRMSLTQPVPEILRGEFASRAARFYARAIWDNLPLQDSELLAMRRLGVFVDSIREKVSELEMLCNKS